MSRSGERQYGDWEARARSGARPVRWWPVLRNGLTFALAAAAIMIALFGFSGR